MAYESIFIGIYEMLQRDAVLVPSVLGPVTLQNQRLYRAFPSWQPAFDTYEPQYPREGWLVIEEPAPGLRAAIQQYGSDHESIEVTFHVYGTIYQVAHDALDVLDKYFHWTVEQQRDVIWSEWILLFTRRLQNKEAYAQEIKLYNLDLQYRMELVREVQLAP